MNDREVVIPRSVSGLPPSHRDLVNRISVAELERRRAEAAVDELVIKGRKMGLPWSALGYAIGVSGQAVAQKYGKRL